MPRFGEKIAGLKAPPPPIIKEDAAETASKNWKKRPPPLATAPAVAQHGAQTSQKCREKHAEFFGENRIALSHSV